MEPRGKGPRRGRSGTLVRGAAAVALTCAGLAVTPAQAAPAPANPAEAEQRPAATGPRLEVNRTTGLLDGDIVEFTITGGPPKAYVWVEQCARSASADTCDDDTGRQFRVYPDGTYQPSPKKLYARLDTTAGTFDCRAAPADNPCTLALTDNTGALLTTVPLRLLPHGRPQAPPTLHVSPDEGLVDGQCTSPDPGQPHSATMDGDTVPRAASHNCAMS
ncbi:hypothetical protein [Streptomyces sp. NPDC060031]|uniref:hypothetical protein n=1 Tax=Streptomyces sp. NPDC060031 TaxID=3347043 RepID=UPI00368A9136